MGQTGAATMMRFMRDDRGSAVRWFAFATLVLSVAGAAGARGLAWLSQSGRISVVAYGAPAPTRQTATDGGIDMTPTGAIPSKGVLIRIR